MWNLWGALKLASDPGVHFTKGTCFRNKWRTIINRVFLTGAGASCAYSESPTGLRPPLANGLITSYDKLDISMNQHVRIGELVNYVRDERGIDPLHFNEWSEDIEAFFTEIDQALGRLAIKRQEGDLQNEDFGRLGTLSKLYNQLVFLFSSIFNEIQNGPVCEAYQIFAEELGINDTVVTFNWDTLLDRALMSTGKWSLRNGYGIEPASVFSDEWLPPDNSEFCGDGTKLLKLHGSTNWLIPWQSINLSTGLMQSLSTQSIGQLFVFQSASQPYDTYEGRYWGPYEPFSYCYYPPNIPAVRDDGVLGQRRFRIVSAADLPEHGKCEFDDPCVYSMPLIIPPVLKKNYSRFGTILSQVWAQAQETISNCNELFIIGYSFPDTDTESRKLLLRSLCRNSKVQRVTIVNPEPERIVDVLRNEIHVPKEIIQVIPEKFEPVDGSFRYLFKPS